jgi:hypothetical protein
MTGRRRSTRDSVVLDGQWIAAGACLPHTDLPWALNAEDATDTERRQMAEICAGCPVLSECDDYADAARVTAGFWAGMVRNDTTARRSSRRKHAADASADDLGGVA